MTFMDIAILWLLFLFFAWLRIWHFILAASHKRAEELTELNKQYGRKAS
jgi:hypothetical protein